MRISTDLGRIRVQVSGPGTPIVCWPSLLMDGSMWAAQRAHFAERYQVVLVDPPGHGQSDPLTELFTFDECARTATQILDGIGAERAHFVGNSWGGMIGMRGRLVRSAVDAFTGPTTRRSRPEVVATIEQAIRRIDVRSTSWAVTSVVPRRPNQLALFKQITVPVLVIAGAEDATFPVAETKAMAEAIPARNSLSCLTPRTSPPWRTPIR